MIKDSYKTPVVFRKFSDGDVIALFPFENGSTRPITCLCYQHIGQHGIASVEIIDTTTLATESEYSPLFAELESLGYNLKVLKRIPRNAYDVRLSKLSLS